MYYLRDADTLLTVDKQYIRLFDNIAMNLYHCDMVNNFSHSVTSKSLLWHGPTPMRRGNLM